MIFKALSYVWEQVKHRERYRPHSPFIVPSLKRVRADMNRYFRTGQVTSDMRVYEHIFSGIIREFHWQPVYSKANGDPFVLLVKKFRKRATELCVRRKAFQENLLVSHVVRKDKQIVKYKGRYYGVKLHWQGAGRDVFSAYWCNTALQPASVNTKESEPCRLQLTEDYSLVLTDWALPYASFSKAVFKSAYSMGVEEEQGDPPPTLFGTRKYPVVFDAHAQFLQDALAFAEEYS